MAKVLGRRAAILATATLINKEPHRFAYGEVQVPESLNFDSQACAIGWIGYFRGIRKVWRDSLDTVAEKALGINYWNTFETRMTLLMGKKELCEFTAKECVKALRRYANKYHPARKTVRAI